MAVEISHHEKELFNLVAQGDESAFEELFHVYVPKIQPVILKLVKSEAVTKDIIQDIFLNIWVSRAKLPDIMSPSNWIFKITYNRTYSWLEQQAIRQKVNSNIGNRLGESHSYQTEENIFFAETARLVKQAIHQLPPQTRKIYLLSREEGMKIAEIADHLNISVSTVKNTIVNAGKAIRANLARHGIILPLILFIWSV